MDQQKAMVSVILNSNAASISLKTTQASVFGAAKTLIDHMSSALASLRDSLPDSFSPEAEELLLASLQRTTAFDCQNQSGTNKFMLEDPEPFRVFAELLKLLHTVSANFRATGVHLSTTLQARSNRLASERLSEQRAASAGSVVLQVAVSVDALLVQLAVLLEIVLTVRALSGSSQSLSPPSSPRTPLKKPSADESTSQLDFWTEKATASSAFSASSPDLRADLSPRMLDGAAAPTSAHGGGMSKLKRFAKGLRHSNIPSTDDVTTVPPTNRSAPRLVEEALPKRGSLNMLIEGVTHPRLYQQGCSFVFDLLVCFEKKKKKITLLLLLRRCTRLLPVVLLFWES